MPEAVLFDLDGTLADTAPDLGGALNRLLSEQGREPLPMERLRRHVSSGARGMIGAGLGITPADAAYADLQQRFLAIYLDSLCVGTRLFDGMTEHLAELDAKLHSLGRRHQQVAALCHPPPGGLGPAPAQCLHRLWRQRATRQTTRPSLCNSPARSSASRRPAASMSATMSATSISGRAAGMKTVVAGWGYLGDGKPPDDWGADGIATTPQDILGIANANR
jgi:hypothetical protein